MSVCDSTRIFFRVQKILLISLRAGKAAGANLEKLSPERIQAFANRQNGSFLKVLALNDAAGADFVTRQFELRLDENQEYGAPLCELGRRLDDLQCGNKRHVDGDELDRLWNVFWTQLSSIALDRNNARVLAKLPVQLLHADVHGINARSAPLQKTIGKTPM